MKFKGNTQVIVRLAAEKSNQARRRVIEAINELQRESAAINFNTICAAARVSKTFLYDPKHSDLASTDPITGSSITQRRERTALWKVEYSQRLGEGKRSRQRARRGYKDCSISPHLSLNSSSCFLGSGCSPTGNANPGFRQPPGRTQSTA